MQNKEYSLSTKGLDKTNFGYKVNIKFIYLHKGNDVSPLRDLRACEKKN